MKRLFVDSGAFVAKEIANDRDHAAASRAWSMIAGGGFQLWSSEHVLDESATLIARRATYAWAAEWGSDVMGANIEWLRANSDEWRQALLLMRKFADRSVSFTDCISAILMKRAGIRDVFGFDRHFEDLGFRVWPPS
jgi:predicted nucleic acid-binding protein